MGALTVTGKLLFGQYGPVRGSGAGLMVFINGAMDGPNEADYFAVCTRVLIVKDLFGNAVMAVGK